MVRKRSKKPQPVFVLDCSVTMAWYFKDEATAYSKAARMALMHCEAIVPALWPLEVANILVMGERRGRSRVAEASQWLTYLSGLPIRIDPETSARAWSEIMQ